MMRLTLRDVRVELALCLLAPALVLAVVMIPGFWQIGKMKGSVAKRSELLSEIPMLEFKLAKSIQALGSYRVHNGGKDKSGELSLQTSQPATEQGVTVKTVNTEKLGPAETPAALDYRVAMSGEGSLTSIICTLGMLERPVQCFKATSVRLRAKTFTPPMAYDIDCIFMSRCLVSRQDELAPPKGGMSEAVKTLDSALVALGSLAKASPPVLDTRRINTRKGIIIEEAEEATPEGPVPFRINGIVRNGRLPLVMTDRGVVAQGAVLDGYRILKIADDHVLVVSPQGRQEKLMLYQAEAQP